MKEKWPKWALLEGLVRVLSNLLQKRMSDLTSHSFGAILLLTMLIGLVQALLGLFVAHTTKEKLWMHRIGNSGSVAFGVLAFFGINLSFLVFAEGGQLSIHVLIVTLGIIPGALCDRYLFGHSFRPTQLLGIGVAVTAGYCALDAPSLASFTKLPIWVWCSVGTMLLMTANQVISQKIQTYTTPMAKNVWGGGTIAFLGGVSLIAQPFHIAAAEWNRLFLTSSLIGMLSVLLWTFNLWAYRDGAYIALKKLVVNGSLLFFGSVFGMFSGERISVTQGAGFFLYLIAFCLTDRDTWDFIQKKWHKQE